MGDEGFGVNKKQDQVEVMGEQIVGIVLISGEMSLHVPPLNSLHASFQKRC